MCAASSVTDKDEHIMASIKIPKCASVNIKTFHSWDFSVDFEHECEGDQVSYKID